PCQGAYVHIAHPTWSFIAPRVMEPGEERSPRSPEVVLRLGLNAWLRRDVVSDGPAVAGDGWRLGVDLVDEQGEGAGDAGLAGGFEGDGDRRGGEGDDAGEAADDGFAGDGAVF